MNQKTFMIQTKSLMERLSTTIKRYKIRKYGILSAFSLSLLTFIIYLPALKNGFVNWDDNIYVYENQNIRSFDLDFISWSLLPNGTGMWHPLTWFSLAMDYALWGLDPKGFHLTNIILHSLNTFLVFILAVNLIGVNGAASIARSPLRTENYEARTVIAASVAALLFGIHPVHVESVVWVGERKDALSVFFILVTLLYYLKYSSRMGAKRLHYIACLLFFTMALMSKSMVVTLPLILLILDFYPIRRFTMNGIKWVVLEKIPFFLLSLITTFMTIWDARLAGMGDSQPFTLTTRLFISARGYIFYLMKMMFPFNLAPLYPYPEKVDIFAVDYLGSVILFLSITIYCLWTLRRGRLILSVWICYIIALLPVIGIVHTGLQDTADRYAYMPSIVFFLLIGVAAGAILERYSKRSMPITILLIFVSVFFINKTVDQIRVWHDSITLWNHEVRLFPNAYRAYFNRGNAYGEIGDSQRALKDYDKSLEIRPVFADAYYNRGILLGSLGRYNESIEDFNKAIELEPSKSSFHNNRANAYFGSGNYLMAIKDYNRATELDPLNREAYYNLGLVYSRLGDSKQALLYFNKATALGSKPRRLLQPKGVH